MISLRKVSLKEANHVYGVTIQKNGITDIVGNINILSVNEKGELIQPPEADETLTDEGSPRAKTETHPPGPDHSPEVA
jgi:hypothetical protein